MKARLIKSRNLTEVSYYLYGDVLYKKTKGKLFWWSVNNVWRGGYMCAWELYEDMATSVNEDYIMRNYNGLPLIIK